jgi:hypothetical protein
MADICDCHQQTPAIFAIDFQWLTVNGVIKIFGIYRVNGEGENFPAILSFLLFDLSCIFQFKEGYYEIKL